MTPWIGSVISCHTIGMICNVLNLLKYLSMLLLLLFFGAGGVLSVVVIALVIVAGLLVGVRLVQFFHTNKSKSVPSTSTNPCESQEPLHFTHSPNSLETGKLPQNQPNQFHHLRLSGFSMRYPE